MAVSQVDALAKEGKMKSRKFDTASYPFLAPSGRQEDTLPYRPKPFGWDSIITFPGYSEPEAAYREF